MSNYTDQVEIRLLKEKGAKVIYGEENGPMTRHMTIEQLPYGEPIKSWLKDRYGDTEANQIWEQTQENYRNYLRDLPDYGGSKNGHARAIYGGLLIFALYPALPDQPPVSELQDFVHKLFMGSFTKLGKIFDLNRPSHMWLIDKVFRMSGNRDRKDIRKYPEGFVNMDAPYDREHHAASYSFTQCPNADFAKKTRSSSCAAASVQQRLLWDQRNPWDIDPLRHLRKQRCL